MSNHCLQCGLLVDDPHATKDQCIKALRDEVARLDRALKLTAENWTKVQLTANDYLVRAMKAEQRLAQLEQRIAADANLAASRGKPA